MKLCMVKNSRAQYFSEPISAHQHNPRFLFKTADQLVNPNPPCASAKSDADCEKLYSSYFIDKVCMSIRASVTPNGKYSNVYHPPQNTLKQFSPISLSEFLEIVSPMKVSSNPIDVLPAKVFFLSH